MLGDPASQRQDHRTPLRCKAVSGAQRADLNRCIGLLQRGKHPLQADPERRRVALQRQVYGFLNKGWDVRIQQPPVGRRGVVADRAARLFCPYVFSLLEMI